MPAPMNRGCARRSLAVLLALLMGLAVSACGERQPDGELGFGPGPSPLPDPSPSPLPPAASPPPTGPHGSGPVISGSVWDTVTRPLAGANVEIVDGAHAGLSMVTGADGRFRLSGPFDSPTTVRASKDGYAARTQVWTCSGASCTDPGPVIGLHLTLLGPALDLAGDFSVTLSAAPACTDLPAEIRSRTYAATSRLLTGTTFFGVELAGTSFLVSGGWGYTHNYFDLKTAADEVVMVLDDGDPTIVEQIAMNTYVAYSGVAKTTSSPGATTIAAPLDGWIEFCARRAPMAGGYGCRAEDRASPTPAQPVVHSRCTSSDHRIVMTRRP